jgi:hypothetical protein
MVVLGKQVEKQKWFAAMGATIHYDWDEESWNRRHAAPTEFRIRIKYGDLQRGPTWIQIRARWEGQTNRYAIHIDQPRYRKLRDKNGNATHHHASYIETALVKIHQDLRRCTDLIDEQVQQCKDHEKKRKEAERERDREQQKVATELGVKLKRDLTDSECLRYGGKTYNIAFHFDHEDPSTEPLFHITQIEGDFTIDDVKKMIQIVGGNPRAIAARLKGNN